jgi:parallel beta-helix repeat protein
MDGEQRRSVEQPAADQRKRSGRPIRHLVLIVILLGGAVWKDVTPVHAATLVVDDDRLQCPGAAFTSIQAAIDAAAQGDAIEVCAGTYAEQVVLGPGKDHLTLRSAQPLAAEIRAPATLSAGGIISVNGARNIAIREFKIAGPYAVTGCAPNILSGIRLEGGVTATISSNHIAGIRPADSALDGCRFAYAINVVGAAQGQQGPPNSVTIEGNLIEGYLRGGIVVTGANSNARIAANRLVGDGPTPVYGQFGMEILRGASVEITANDISRHQYTGPQSVQSSGITLVELSGKARVEGNRLSNNDRGISLFQVSNAAIRMNQAVGHPLWGIGAFSNASDNSFRLNLARDNNVGDCVDHTTGDGTAGTANTWGFNIGGTSTPSGICAGGSAPSGLTP